MILQFQWYCRLVLKTSDEGLMGLGHSTEPKRHRYNMGQALRRKGNCTGHGSGCRHPNLTTDSGTTRYDLSLRVMRYTIVASPGMPKMFPWGLIALQM